jgi:hypothetical protein
MERLKKCGKEGKKIELYIYMYDFITELPSQITPARSRRERKEVPLPVRNRLSGYGARLEYGLTPCGRLERHPVRHIFRS